MADYRRLVSYIYNYEDGVKKNNVGYARVENRNQQCKVTIHIRALSIQKPLNVCMFMRINENIQCITLGEVNGNNGNVDFQKTSLVNDIMNSGFTFDEMGGIILYDSKEKFFGTEWDDKPILAERLNFRQNITREERREAIEAEPVRVVEEEVLSVDHASAMELIAAAADTIEVVKEEEKKKKWEEKTIVKERLVEIPAETVEEKVDEKLEETVDEIVEEKMDEIVGKKVEDKVEETVDEIERDEQEKKVNPFEVIFLTHPKMFPFEGDEIVDCVRIEPQDIGILPIDFWGFANNSFLLHGYYSYRHLIFAKEGDKDHPTYLLGIPGIFHNRDEFMAKMFGFQTFQSIKKSVDKQGEFGYWCTNIELKEE